MTDGAVKRDVVVIGGGPAGLAAASAARKAGAKTVTVFERDPEFGGVLGQCIHDGFGLSRYGEDLTGPEYAHLAVEEARADGVELIAPAMVVGLSGDREVTYVSEQGVKHVKAGAVVLATGCRERTRGAIRTPGARCSGIYTAGVVQQMMNKQNLRVGKRAVILGSGDIGLIVARRLSLEGVHVECVAEIMPYCGGLPRNLVQCLEDYGIPLLTSHTVIRVEGCKSVEAVVLAQVDASGAAVPGTERRIECDLFVLSVGLIPECELAEEAGVQLNRKTGGPLVAANLETNVPGVFACGNCLHVHDIVDAVSNEAESAGAAAAAFASGYRKPDDAVEVQAGSGVGYTVPSSLHAGAKSTLSFRVAAPGRKVVVTAEQDGVVLARRVIPKAMPSVMEHITIPEVSAHGNIVLRAE